MFILITVITGIVGLCLGFLFGPFLEWIGDKISTSESAKKSEKISTEKYNNKVAGQNYDKGSTNDFLNPARSEENRHRMYLIMTLVIFISLASLIIFGNVIFAKVLGGVFIIILIQKIFAGSKK